MRLDGRTGEGEEWKCEKARVRWKGKRGGHGSVFKAKGKEISEANGKQAKGKRGRGKLLILCFD